MEIPIVKWRARCDRVSITADERERASWYKMGLLNALIKYRPKVCVEIGTRMGGTVEIFHEYFTEYKPDGFLVTCDIAEWCMIKANRIKQVLVYPHSESGANEYKNAPRDSYLADWEEGAKNSVENNIEIIRGVLGAGVHADFIYIDGDHTWDGVSKDWLIAQKVCRMGAVAVFDDIEDKRNRCREWYDNNIRPLAWHYEFTDWPVYVGMGVTIL